MRGRGFAVIALSLAVAAGAYFVGRIQGRAAAAPGLPEKAAGRATEPASADARGAGRVRTFSERAAHAVSLPPPRTPLKYAFADLQARADAGDVAAATRLYRDLSLCRRVEKLDRDNARAADELLGETVDAMGTPQLRDYRAQLDAVESRRRTMDGLHAMCDGASREMLNSLVPNLQRAALLGEPYARACYLKRGPNFDPSGFIEHPEMMAAYRRDAQRLIDAGIADGDWRVVDLLRGAYAPGADDLLSAAVGDEPDRYYRYLKLYRLGAQSDREIGWDLATVSSALTASQTAAADAWAQDVFRRNFKGRPIDQDGPLWDPCVFPYE